MEEISDRIKKIMTDNELSSSQMAERIGVQPSAISHILSGRNKPSLDFILKVLESFEKVSSNWLLLGRKTEDETVGKTDDFSPQNQGAKTIEKVLILYTDKTVEEYRS